MTTAIHKEKKLWTCPKCGRQFGRREQAHSCRAYPLANHFKGKPVGKILYEKFKQLVKEQVGSFKVESLECCIHFVNISIFTAVMISRNKIRVDFSLSRKIKSSRIVKSGPLSAHRYVYYVDIFNEYELNIELMEWIKEAYDKR